MLSCIDVLHTPGPPTPGNRQKVNTAVSVSCSAVPSANDECCTLPTLTDCINLHFLTYSNLQHHIPINSAIEDERIPIHILLLCHAHSNTAEEHSLPLTFPLAPDKAASINCEVSKVCLHHQSLLLHQNHFHQNVPF